MRSDLWPGIKINISNKMAGYRKWTNYNLLEWLFCFYGFDEKLILYCRVPVSWPND